MLAVVLQNIQNFSVFLGIIWAAIIGFSATVAVFLKNHLALCST